MTLDTALIRTANAARALSVASRSAARDRDSGFFNSADYAELKAATVAQVGRVTVSASVGGNSRASHVRHTFKIDGKRASRAQAQEALA